MIVFSLIAAAFMNGDWLAVVAHTQKYHDAEPPMSCTSFFEEFKTQCFWAMAVGYVEVLHQGSRQGSRVEVPAETPSAPTPGVGPDQMGLHRTNGDERGVRGDGHARHLRWLQPGLYAIRPVPVVVVGNPVAGDIRPAVPFYGLALYTYYHGIVQHSGITFKARWWQPWQPDCMFHDNHHQYCHVNYGFNCYLWDEIHGSVRKTDRCYSTHTDSWGSGRLLTELSDEELRQETFERFTENPEAYRENFNPYLL
ncbi:uncharacterized protein LOC112681578 isoform X2 [Sipha flava]|uniref:Uncharacterized protein LOC112681578 isoform X2 n=2 Tax=Sipha flava TaxID=143950 RepID=A0A8B8F9T7_9HEMI|nr:uncharacterized protein LOC112681578 isoform X2 [Sipha flava]